LPSTRFTQAHGSSAESAGSSTSRLAVTYRALLAELEKLGQPPANSGAWRNVLKARQAALTNEARQIKTALTGDAPAFVRAVYQQARDYNQLVFTSAVFGVQSCTFS
jgi:hypothetical protein